MGAVGAVEAPQGVAQIGGNKEGSMYVGYRGARVMTPLERRGKGK